MAEKRSGEQRRDPGLRALSRRLPQITAPLLKGRSRAEATLLQDWPRIAGPELADVTRVHRLAFPKRDERRNARLTLACEPGAALNIQHSTPQLIERINGYFGFALVAEIALQQRHMAQREEPRRKAPAAVPGAAELAEAETVTQGLEDPELRGAMTRLAAAVAARRKRPKD